MILILQQKHSESRSAAKQIKIDFIKKTYCCGYYISHSADIKQLTATQMAAAVDWLKQNGFTTMLKIKI